MPKYWLALLVPLGAGAAKSPQQSYPELVSYRDDIKLHDHIA